MWHTNTLRNLSNGLNLLPPANYFPQIFTNAIPNPGNREGELREILPKVWGASCIFKEATFTGGGSGKERFKKKIISGTSDVQVSKTGDTPVEKREIYPGQSRSSQCWEQLLSACHGENSGLNKIYQGPESKWGDTRKLKQNKNSTAALNPSSWDVKQKNFPHLQKLVAQL